ncbi:MAG: AAA family ATPase [Okeania sp. SIO3B5]|uniref:AAA family ATPase n=1 Tax=Okeania sp. SIO3B5 TaxID=2607811 RepID=UPI0013FFDD8E|nr:AAA family ATPase [Okeania sp. SIO3B5]NEO57810.1 AAA family ATPase [Okeania sp. SIO3B5]
MPPTKFYPTEPVPPDKFVGRMSELYTIFDQINNRGHVAIDGIYGMGKSSLLKYIKSSNFWEEKGLNFSEALIVYYDCSVISFTPNSFWQEVLKDLRNEAEGDADLQGKIDNLLKEEKTIEIRDIRKILQEIGKREKFFLLLLDDYHGILRTPEDYINNLEKSREMQTFLSGLRNLAVHSTEGQYFSTVVAAFRRLDRLGPELPPGGSPWYNHYLYVDLKPFSQEDIDNYFFNSKHFLISILDNIQKEKVLEITGGCPILLQHAGYIFSQSEQDIDINTFKAKFKNQTEQIFKDIWRDLTADEQNLLLGIVIDNLNGEVGGKRYSVDGINKVFERNRYTLTTLQQKGVIYQNSEQDKYNFYSSLMEDLVVQKFDEKISDPREDKILFEKFGIKLTEKQAKAVKKNAPLINKILGTLIKVVPGINLFNKSDEK